MVGDSVIKKGGRECDKVIRSLVSGFPNEVDFALNVLTMMSFDKPDSVPIAKVMLQDMYTLYYSMYTCMKCMCTCAFTRVLKFDTIGSMQKCITLAVMLFNLHMYT